MNTTPAYRSARSTGFTLLEILIAVAIFAVVLAAINTVFYSALRLRNRAAASFEKSRPLEQALQIIRRDLANIVPPGGTLAGTLQTGNGLSGMNSSSLTSSSPSSSSEGSGYSSLTNSFGGIPGQASPQFTTTTGIIDGTTPWSQFQRVYYYLAPSTNETEASAFGGQDLVRSVTRNLLPSFDDQPQTQVLLSGVESITFFFYDGSVWDEIWDSSTSEEPLPRAIKVELGMAPETSSSPRPAPIDLIVPIDVQGHTNATGQASTSGGSQ